MDHADWPSFIITAIGNFGFPIVITSYLLLRFEKKMEKLSESIQVLAQVMRDGRNDHERK